MTLQSNNTYIGYQVHETGKYATIAITNSEYMLNALTKTNEFSNAGKLKLPEISRQTIDELLNASGDSISGSHIGKRPDMMIYSIVLTGTIEDINNLYLNIYDAAKNINKRNRNHETPEHISPDHAYDIADDKMDWMQSQMAKGIPWIDINLSDYRTDWREEEETMFT